MSFKLSLKMAGYLNAIFFIFRFIGQGLKVTYEHCQGSGVRTLNTDLSLSQVELLECLYSTDSHTTKSGAQYTEVFLVTSGLWLNNSSFFFNFIIIIMNFVVFLIN